MEKKQNGFIVFLWSILPMAVAIGIQFAVQMPVIFFISFKISMQYADLMGTDEYFNAYTAEYLRQLQDPVLNDVLKLVTMIVLAAVFAVWFWKSKASKGMTSLKKALPIRNNLLIVAAGYVTQVAMSLLLTLILPLFPKTNSSYTELLESLVGGSPVVAVITVAILAPFAEELIFRGLTLRGTIRHWENFVLVNFLQALYFGIYHMNIVQGVYAFLMGLIFGYVAYRLNNIFASILFHAAVNASGLFLFLPEALFDNSLLMLLVAVAGCAIIWALLYLLKIPAKPAPAPVPTAPGPVYGPGYGMPGSLYEQQANRFDQQSADMFNQQANNDPQDTNFPANNVNDQNN